MRSAATTGAAARPPLVNPMTTLVDRSGVVDLPGPTSWPIGRYGPLYLAVAVAPGRRLRRLLLLAAVPEGGGR